MSRHGRLPSEYRPTIAETRFEAYKAQQRRALKAKAKRRQQAFAGLAATSNTRILSKPEHIRAAKHASRLDLDPNGMMNIPDQILALPHAAEMSDLYALAAKKRLAAVTAFDQANPGHTLNWSNTDIRGYDSAPRRGMNFYEAREHSYMSHDDAVYRHLRFKQQRYMGISRWKQPMTNMWLFNRLETEPKNL